MERIRFVTHRGVRVLLLDMTGLTELQETRRVAEAAKAAVAREPPGSLLLVTDTTGSRYNSESLAAMKEMAAHNTPYLKASCVVVQAATHRVAVAAVSLFTGRALKAFGTREEALDWLVEQA